ncbi:MAG: 30S ribosomal protein S9 [Candidatus Taylorbacteria bacterium RIFCSPLOWO2_12_FULL_47_20]|uniref:Small ribosomal subunit protein uS9 n=2 Tax=Candidatus Tayloriibacteriota TaxID=1817919 RepID=A0A1G2PCG9_9BACT|nr:MAG: 30S ribosomal protein S9 [Candidatus Taylorbacteria bacterium RIFCSPLOWO2_02_FULL_46_40]OHA45332.1 MAG: 30S ribosomal protein S9 [Candidatus Taylorbacteria bacterium RIFCSPLOWO2_12_FULL_47_20]
MIAKQVVKHNESRYIGAVGRRKTAIARVRVTLGAKEHFTVNEKPVADYFKTKELQHVIFSALRESGLTAGVTAKVVGGGTTAQAEAVRHGVARAAIIIDPELRKKLKKLGFLKRDPRAKERRKFGLKKARKAPQWSKR